MTADIWDTARAIANGTLIIDGGLKAIPKVTNRHLVVVGGKSSGKSALIRQYLDKRSSEMQDTIGISYSFIKQQRGDSFQTDVGNIWEVPSTPHVQDMLEIVIKGHNISNVMVFIVVDLTQPETMLSIFANIFPVLQVVVGDNTGKTSANRLSVWILANKFDTLTEMNIEQEKRQAISQTLCQMAKRYGLGLMYSSTRQAISEARIRNVVNQWFFEAETEEMKEVMDPLKLIFIPPATSSSAGELLPRLAQNDFHSWQSSLKGHFAQKSALEFLPTATNAELEPKYSEPEIDSVYALSLASIKAKTSQVLKSRGST